MMERVVRIRYADENMAGFGELTLDEPDRL